MLSRAEFFEPFEVGFAVLLRDIRAVHDTIFQPVPLSRAVGIEDTRSGITGNDGYLSTFPTYGARIAYARVAVLAATCAPTPLRIVGLGIARSVIRFGKVNRLPVLAIPLFLMRRPFAVPCPIQL